jgi:hypothetical protein
MEIVCEPDWPGGKRVVWRQDERFSVSPMAAPSVGLFSGSSWFRWVARRDGEKFPQWFVGFAADLHFANLQILPECATGLMLAQCFDKPDRGHETLVPSFDGLLEGIAVGKACRKQEAGEMSFLR